MSQPLVKPPAPPFIPARWSGAKQTPKALVIHGTVSPCKPGGARSIAHFFSGLPASRKASAHYVTDPEESIQTVFDHTIAFHCGFNAGSLSHELCDPQKGPADRWNDAAHQAMLARAAELDAQLCLAYGIEIRRPSIVELKVKGPHGIYGHNDSRLAFGHTSHVDPGEAFAWDHYIGLVRSAADRILATAQQPTEGEINGDEQPSGGGGDTPATQRLTIVFGNIKGSPRMPIAHAASDIDQAFALAVKRGAAAVALTEIAHPDYFDAVKDAAASAGYLVFRSEENVTAVRKDVNVTRHVGLQLSDGVPHLSPDRTALVTALRLGTITVKIDATHLVSRWQSYAAADRDHATRVQLANLEIKRLSQRAAAQRKANQLPIILGDLNALSEVAFGAGQVALVPISGPNLRKMIQAYALPPAGLDVTKVADGVIPQTKLHTDHPLRWFTVDITRAA